VNRYLLGLLITFLFGQFAGLAAPARLDSIIDEPKPEPLATPATVVTHDPKLSAKPSELRRLDFRIEGKSCPVCLLAIQTKLKSLNGVQDAAVMLKRPYGTSVIYRADKASADYILMMLKAKDAAIKVSDVSDNKIDNMPIPLIPPFMPDVEPAKPNPDSLIKPNNGGL
jgi:copper chaperone CopZ